MKKAIRFSLTAIITMIMCLIIAPSAFAEDTVYTTSDVAGGVRIDSVTTTETKLVIPDEIDGKVVVELGPKSFTGTPVEEITIPANVISMYKASYGSALEGIQTLDKVIFAEGMRTIPSNALLNCSTVTEIVLPESLTAISYNAFYGCSALEILNLPDSITSIGEAAFCKCTSLTDIKLPKKLTILGEGAFAKCTELKKIVLPESLKTIECLAFYQTQISEIAIPASIEKMYSHGSVDNIDGIYSNDFSSLYGMNYLEKVTFSDGIKTVPKKALENITSVKEVILPESITSISSDAFKNCTSLTNINLPDSITSIGPEAFRNCSSLSEIYSPERLTFIGEGAFAKCTKLKKIVLPESLKTIECLAFYQTQISEITIPASIEKMYSHGSVDNIDGIYSRDFSALYGMNYLEKVIFADGMKTVPSNAIKDCEYIEEVVIYDCNTSVEEMKVAAEENDYILTVLPCESCVKYLIGDVNGDGRITAADARIVLRISAQLEKVENYNLPFEVFDIIRDEKITAADARKILRISAQLE